MADTKDLIEKFEAELENPLPTPPVGWPIVWHRAAQADYVVPATVAAVQGPGKVVINIDIPHQNRQTKDGCLHSSHPQHEKRANPISVKTGSWDYVEGMDIPDSHYDYHRDNLKRRIVDLKSQMLPDVEAVKKKLASLDKKTKTKSKAGAEEQPVG